MYFDTTDNTTYLYDGTSWQKVASDGSEGILDRRYGDGTQFTYDIEDNVTDGDAKKFNIGIPEGDWIGYKIVAEIPTDEELLVEGAYESYAWNKNNLSIAEEIIEIDETNYFKYYNPGETAIQFQPENINIQFYLNQGGIKTTLPSEDYYYSLTFSSVSGEQYIYENDNGDSYIKYNGQQVIIPIKNIQLNLEPVSCQIILAQRVLLNNIQPVDESGTPEYTYLNKASQIIYFNYAMNDDMARLSLNAFDITASIDNNKLKFDSTGLSIYGDGLKIYPSLNSIQPSFFADEKGNLTLNGLVNASGGTIGGWSIDKFGLYSDAQSIGLYSGNLEELEEGSEVTYQRYLNAPVRFYAGYNEEGHNFAVNANGQLLAKQAMIEGEIHANNGSISNTMLIGNGAKAIKIFGGDANNTSYISTNSYASGALGAGWRITSDGDAEFSNITARGKIVSSVFEHNRISAIGGSLYIAPTVHLSMPSTIITNKDENDAVADNNSCYVIWDYGNSFTGAGGRQVWAETEELRLEGIVNLSVSNSTYNLSNIKAIIHKLPVGKTILDELLALVLQDANLSDNQKKELEDNYQLANKSGREGPHNFFVYLTNYISDNSIDVDLSPIEEKYSNYIGADRLEAGNIYGNPNNLIIKIIFSETEQNIKSTILGNNFIEGTLLILYGTKSNASGNLQKNGIYLTAVDEGGPFIDVYDITGESSSMPATRMGNLSGINDPNFLNITGYGLYSTNAYLTGELILPNASISNQSKIGYMGEGKYLLISENSSDDIKQSAIRLWAGAEYPVINNNTVSGAVAPFIVTQDGSLYAKKGIFEGTIRAKDGYFSGIIQSAGIVLDDDSKEYSHFYVAKQKSPANYNDYILDIGKTGLSIWEGALQAYSDHSAERIYSYQYNENLEYSEPLPYIFLCDDNNTLNNTFQGRLVSHSIHNYQCETETIETETIDETFTRIYSVVLNKGLWFYNAERNEDMSLKSETQKRQQEQTDYENSLSLKVAGLALNNNSLEITALNNVNIQANSTIIKNKAEFNSDGAVNTEIKIGSLSIYEVKDTANKTIGVNIF